MNVAPSFEVPLGHRAYFLDASESAERIVAASEFGTATLLGPSLETEPFQIAGGIRGLSVDSKGERVVFASVNEGLVVLGFPELNLSAIGFRKRDVVQSCLFSPDGDLLWAACRVDDQTFDVLLYETDGWKPVAQARFSDNFGESHISIHRTGLPNTVSIWVAAGQDGQQVYWCSYLANAIKIQEDPRLQDHGPLAFNDGGTEFLGMRSEAVIARYRYPTAEEIGSIEVEDEETSDEEYEPFQYGTHCYLDHEYAAIAYAEGRSFKLKLADMSLSDEIVISGHEPVPINVMYPGLGDNGNLCTDLHDIQRYGAVVITTHRRPGWSSPSEIHDTIAIFPLSEWTKR